MKTIDITSTTEYLLAKEMESAVNSCNFDYKVFAEQIKTFHPTLQQNFYKLLRECLKVMADESRFYDDRNRASHQEARLLVDFLEENGRPIPYI